ncbi:MAG: hypothetical protein JWQ89_1447 [Devosia sp.]|nr:hypothetical protein [Devosia sp.]
MAQDEGSRCKASPIRGATASRETTPHPPFGHLLPQGRRQGEKSEIVGCYAARVVCSGWVRIAYISAASWLRRSRLVTESVLRIRATRARAFR